MSSTEQTRAFISRYLAALDKGLPTDQRELDRLVAETVTAPSLKEHIAMFAPAFPGYRVAVEDMVVEGDKVAIRATMTATHRGEIMGIPPSNEEVSLPFMAIYQVAGDKIVGFWPMGDFSGFFQKLAESAKGAKAAA